MAKHFNWIKRISELEKAGVPFAIATVVDTVAPTSAKPMSKAIITEDGHLEGWIGGGCSQDIIISEALKCIKSGKSVLIRLSPNEDKNSLESYKKNVLINCESEGTLEFHLEPVLPMKKLVIYGTTPSAETLANLGYLMNFEVHLMGENSETLTHSDNVHTGDEMESVESASFTIVATQGKGDLKALMAAMDSHPEYLALIASKRKGDKLVKRLKKKGISKEDIEKIKYPAGLDIGAVTPQEIAASIIAEIIQVMRPKIKEEVIIDFMQIKEGQQKDPICGMGVYPEKTEYQLGYKNKMYYFCCGGCLDKFKSKPAVYINSTTLL
ncbi:MAG: XdhC family protein [Candidatus Marinimicrobia bacterium]|nr:XdhC family protein [Candidatus Neomarinimicrobiota bacterium]